MGTYRQTGDCFGEKLTNLGQQKGWKSAADIAEALYENKQCFELVHPRNRDKKYRINKEKDISAIKRRVQEHVIPTKKAKDIPGNYILAYSILFDCSLDYLFGKIDEAYPNAEIADIGKKTGLSAKAINRLMSRSKIYLDSFSCQYYPYEFLYNDIDTEAYVDVTKFWSDIFENDICIELPESWVEMAVALQMYKANEQQLVERNTEGQALLSDNKEKIDSIDAEKRKMIYYGCAGVFDRKVGNFFHELAEHFEIPKMESYEETSEGEK